MAALKTSGLKFVDIEKRYGGIYALRRVSLEIVGGECVAVVGRNGSGKTTLLRVAAGLVRPTRGTVTMTQGLCAEIEEGGVKPPLQEIRDVQSTNPGRARHGGALQKTVPGATATRPGYVAHTTMVYDELTAEENLVLFGKLLDVERPVERAEELLREVGLIERRDSAVRTFSRGMRQRMAIARALIHRPSVLLLDEPATGLDTAGIEWLAGTLRELKGAGCTIVMSLHGESEISAMATRGVRLDAGAVVADTRGDAVMGEIFR